MKNVLNVTNNILRHFPICLSLSAKEKPSRIKKLIFRTAFDSIVVAGVVFFSTLASLGTNDISENVRVALTSSVISGGLSFFSELKNNKKKII